MDVLVSEERPLNSAVTCDQSKQCRLMSLPAELRTHIWSYLLIQDLNQHGQFSSQRNSSTSDEDKRTRRICANILSTCKQINREGLPILYGQNIFSAHPSLLTGLPSFCLRTRPNRVTLPPVTFSNVRQLIRRFIVLVRLDTDAQFTHQLAEKCFTGVEELEIEVFQSSYGTCDFTTLALFEGVRAVSKALVRGSIGDGNYAAHLSKVIESPIGTVWPAYHERYVGGDQAWDAWTQGNR